MLSPISGKIWSYLPQRLMDIRSISGQVGANRILLRPHNGSVRVFLFPITVKQALTLDILSCFALNEFSLNFSSKPLKIIIDHQEKWLHEELTAFKSHFDCSVLSDEITVNDLLVAADKFKSKFLSGTGLLLPHSKHLALLAYILKLFAIYRYQPVLLILYKKDIELIYTVTNSLPKRINDSLGFIVLEEPHKHSIPIGCPDNTDTFLQEIAKLPTGITTEHHHKIATCESFSLLFHYDEHDQQSFSSKRLDECYRGFISCKNCKAETGIYLIQKYKDSLIRRKLQS